MGNNSLPEIEALSLELHGCACLKLPFPPVTLYAQRGLCPLWAEPLNRLEHRAPERQEVRSVEHECDSYTFSGGQHAPQGFVGHDHSHLCSDLSLCAANWVHDCFVQL